MISTVFEFTNRTPNSASWTVPDDLAYFSGHFPNNPILPAVAIMDVTLEFLRLSQNNRALQIQQIPVTKFMMPVTPKMTVRLMVHSSAENRWQVEWRSDDEKQMYAKLDLVLQ